MKGNQVETARLIRELGSEEFAIRERATGELQGRGPWAFAGFEEAVAGADLEVQGRVAAALVPGKFTLPRRESPTYKSAAPVNMPTS